MPPAPQPQPAASSEAPPACGVTLPSGWQVAWTAAGEQYYVDHNLRQTHWTLPYHVMLSMYAPINGRVSSVPAHLRRPIHDERRGTKACLHFAKGSCPFGARCAFRHEGQQQATV
jgi:hypothetical protein